MPIVQCAECATTVFRTESFVVNDSAVLHVPQHHFDIDDLLTTSAFCTVRCVLAFSARTVSTNILRCYVWRHRFDDWSEIGVCDRRVNSGSGWKWTDTGEARWIEENVTRLREAGEIS
jgi:hypothetical protein